jgi:hypothetical protein
MLDLDSLSFPLAIGHIRVQKWLKETGDLLNGIRRQLRSGAARTGISPNLKWSSSTANLSTADRLVTK